ncbi:MAG: sensor histidine kinase [Mycobacterium sp.]
MTEKSIEIATTGTPRKSRGAPLTVQGWQVLVLSIMGVVVLAGAVAGAVLLSRTDEVLHDLTRRIGPARISAYQLQSALRDQETAVRGYALAGHQQFLDPYYEGIRAEQAAAAQIREGLAGSPDLVADLDAIEQASASWRSQYAEPLIASVTPAGPTTYDAGSFEDGKAEFDRIRTLFNTQNDNLATVRTAAGDELNRVKSWRDRVLAAMLITFFVTAIILAWLVNSAVTRPLEALAASCRRITEGNFGERIIPRGPKDIQAIAVDVENMRQRIVDELEASRSARSQLAAQADELDVQAIELRRSNAELEQFAYVASHDLQEPLRKVTAFCQLLEKRYGDKLDERGVEYIAFAVDGAKRMQVLINDLLTFSRVGRLNATYDAVDLNAALDRALENLSTAIEESDAKVLRPANPLPEVAGDPTLLSMMWQNLIGNAIKFRRDGETPVIEVDCRAGTGERDGQWLFTLSDNGIGIGEQFADKVFVIFQRLHARDTYSGTGIGLALCKKIVEYHGGSIWIDTSYVNGTRFQFTLPTVEAVPVAVPDHHPAAFSEGTPE